LKQFIDLSDKLKCKYYHTVAKLNYHTCCLIKREREKDLN
jgi:hypothetical protein